MLLSLNTMAQIDLNDRNWDTLFIEDFSIVRDWSENKWQDGSTDATSFWRCFANESWPDGVTTSVIFHRQAYQPSKAKFSLDSTMKLIGEFKSQEPLRCGEGYKHAPWAGTGHSCDSIIANQHPSVHYHSGMIETINPVGFGYYEVECKIPIHKGASSSFWFWGNVTGLYEEIDVVEHSALLCKTKLEKEISCGIWYNPDGPTYTADSNGYHAHEYSRIEYILPETAQPLDQYHVFGCLWMPERVTFYCDGEIVNECTNQEHIPQHSMWLKITHKEDIAAYDSILQIENTIINDTIWGNWNDTMTINYVKAYRLKTDCDTDAIIHSYTDFSNFDYSVKHSITMGSITGILSIPNNIEFTMRAVNSIIIDGGFEIPIGTCMTLITQDCPYCSDE